MFVVGVGLVLRDTRSSGRVLLVLVLLATVCLVLAGCGGSGDAHGGPVSGQHVSCPGDPVGSGHFACTTTMRLVCRRGSGRTVASQVPGGVNGVESGTQVWFKFSKSSSGAGWTGWVPIGGKPLQHGRVTYRWPGARQARTLAKIPNGAAGGPYWEVFQVSAKCRR